MDVRTYHGIQLCFLQVSLYFHVAMWFGLDFWYSSLDLWTSAQKLWKTLPSVCLVTAQAKFCRFGLYRAACFWVELRIKATPLTQTSASVSMQTKSSVCRNKSHSMCKQTEFDLSSHFFSRMRSRINQLCAPLCVWENKALTNPQGSQDDLRLFLVWRA